MYLIQLLLPLHNNEKEPFPARHFDTVREELTDRFGGVTAFVRTPAVGLWKDSNEDVSRDDMVMFEVMSAELDKDWWISYRLRLQQKFRQEKLLVWASSVIEL
jgi:hypothetical protein